MKNFEKEAVEKAFKSLNEFLNSLNLEVDNHCEFVSVIIPFRNESDKIFHDDKQQGNETDQEGRNRLVDIVKFAFGNNRIDIDLIAQLAVNRLGVADYGF